MRMNSFYKQMPKSALLFIVLVAASVARAGIIDAPYVHGGLALNHAAPVVAHVGSQATSYSNHVRVVHNSVPVIKSHSLTPAVHSAHFDVAPELSGGHYGFHR